MIIILAILWILIWGLVGYFTVRAIQVHIETKRWEKYQAARAMYYPHYLMGQSKKSMKSDEITSNPFEGLL